MIELLDGYIKEVENSQFINPHNFPVKRRGVYVIFESNTIIYIGESKDLYKRMNSQHISANSSFRGSVFRRSLCQRYNKEPGTELRRWILDNCKFKYMEIADKDLCSLVEKYLIYKLRDENNLLNK